MHSVRLLKEEDLLDVSVVDLIIVRLSMELSESGVEVEGDLAAGNYHR
jgi:hypothetical protein